MITACGVVNIRRNEGNMPGILCVGTAPGLGFEARLQRLLVEAGRALSPNLFRHT
jgi:hypothetical protein